jgi:hypothetical protein
MARSALFHRAAEGALGGWGASIFFMVLFHDKCQMLRRKIFVW